VRHAERRRSAKRARSVHGDEPASWGARWRVTFVTTRRVTSPLATDVVNIVSPRKGKNND